MALENHSYPEDVRVRNEARELVGAGLEVTVLAPRGPGQPRRERVEGVDVRRYRLPGANRAAGIAFEYAVALVQLSLLLCDEVCRGAAVIHLHNPPDIFFPLAGIARLLGRTVVFDHHDLAPELYEQKFGRGWPRRLLCWCERMTMQVAHVVISANESHRSIALSRGGKQPEDVTVVRNGPRRSTIARAPEARGGRITDPRLCFVGALGSQDGVSTLPEVLAMLTDRGLDPTLTVVGDGPESSKVRLRAQDLGVERRIEYTGRVAHEDVPGLIAESDICLDVAPASPLNHRSTMIKIGEYLAAGRPIVSFALKETQRTAGDCALYAPDANLDAFCALVAELCGDPNLREELAKSAIARAHALTWERSAEALHDVYSRIGRTRAARERSAG